MVRRAIFQPLARGKDSPRARIASCISAGAISGPPSSPQAARKAMACSAVTVRPIRACPSSVVSRRTRMFSGGSRSHRGSKSPVTRRILDSVWAGRPATSASQSARHCASSMSRQEDASAA